MQDNDLYSTKIYQNGCNGSGSCGCGCGCGCGSNVGPAGRIGPQGPIQTARPDRPRGLRVPPGQQAHGPGRRDRCDWRD